MPAASANYSSGNFGRAAQASNGLDRTWFLHCSGSNAYISDGQTRSFADVASMSGLPPEAAVEPTSMDGREVPLPEVAPFI
jgi:hypothetical protein